MSYDLFFLVPKSREPISAEAFEDYFANRKGFEVKNDQAWYRNENTGVYFVFDYGEPELDDEISDEFDDGFDDDAEHVEDDLHSANVMFNLNYFRPHIFGLEAEPEVSQFVAHFDLQVDDPQTSGMGRGDYSPNGFLEGWNAGNAFGFTAIIANMQKEGMQPLAELHTLPTDEIERHWRWNYYSDQLQDSLGEEVFVPHVVFVLSDGKLQSAVVWGDAIPITLPNTDLILMVRDELAPKRGFFRRKAQDFCIAQTASALKQLKDFEYRTDHDEPYHLLRYDNPPADVLQFFENAEADTSEKQVVAIDQILNREAIEQAIAEPKMASFEVQPSDTDEDKADEAGEADPTSN